MPFPSTGAEGTHPIQQQLDNLKNAGLLYGHIIYHKAPIMMQKLEERLGAGGLQRGLREYLFPLQLCQRHMGRPHRHLGQGDYQTGIADFDRQWVKQRASRSMLMASNCSLRPKIASLQQRLSQGG